MTFNMGRRVFNRVLAQPAWQWALVILALHLALSGLYSVAVPPWEAHDEWAHYKFVEYVARYRALPPPDVRLTNEYVYDEANQPPLYYVIAALPVMLVDTSDGVTPDVNPYFGIETGAGGINVAIHHPDQERFPWRGTILALHLARWVSVVIGSLGLVAVYKLGRLLTPQKPVIALTGLIIAALSPQYLFISSVVTNDVLIAALGCVIAWLGIEVVLKGLRPWSAAGLALAIGLAFVTKLSAPALAPFVLLALIAGAIRSLRRGGNRLTVLLTFAIPLAGGLAIGGWWLARNVRLTGQLLPRDPWVTFRFVDRWFSRTGAVEPMQWEALPSALVYGFRTFWASFGWGNLEAYGWVYWFFVALCGGGLVGLVIWLADRRVRRELQAAAGLVALLAGSVLSMAAYRDFDQGSTLIRGRYLLPALAPVAVLIALGLDALFRVASGRAKWPAWALPATVAAVLTCANVLLPWQVIAPTYAPPPASATGTQPGDPVALQPGERPLGARFLAAADAPVPVAELVAYELWPETVRPGQALGVTLVWRVLRPLAANYTIGVHLLDANMVKVGEVNVYPGRGAYATTLWRPGDVFRDIYWVPVQREIAQPVLGRVKVALFVDATAQADPAVVGQHLPVTDARGAPLGEAAIFGRFKLAPAQPPAHPPAEPVAGPGLATVGDTIRLAAATWQADQTPVLAGSVFTVTLTWAALGRPPADYQVFVHLDGENGPLAFGDGPPAGGAYPTGLWERGDRIEETHVVRVPDDTPSGTYRLVVGMYDDTDRRPATVGPAGERLASDQIFLDDVVVVRLERRGFFPLYLVSGSYSESDKDS